MADKRIQGSNNTTPGNSQHTDGQSIYIFQKEAIGPAIDGFPEGARKQSLEQYISTNMEKSLILVGERQGDHKKKKKKKKGGGPDTEMITSNQGKKATEGRNQAEKQKVTA